MASRRGISSRVSGMGRRVRQARTVARTKAAYYRAHSKLGSSNVRPSLWKTRASRVIRSGNRYDYARKRAGIGYGVRTGLRHLATRTKRRASR